MNLTDYAFSEARDICIFELYSKEHKKMEPCGEVAREFWIPGFEETQPLCDEHAHFVLDCYARGELKE